MEIRKLISCIYLVYLYMKVQIYLRLQCQALHEDQFKPIIIDNYYSQTHFWFELDHAQTNKLMSLLSSLAVAPSTSLPQNVAKWRNLFKDMPLAHKEEGNEVNETDSYVDFYQLYKSNADMLLPTSDAVPGSSCNNQPSEPHFKKRTLPSDKKEYILMKLKEMTLTREHSDSSLKQSVEDTAIVNDVSMEQSSIPKEQEIFREKSGPVTSPYYSDAITQACDAIIVKCLVSAILCLLLCLVYGHFTILWCPFAVDETVRRARGF